MENQWCKILIINNQQVLVMTDYDEEDEVYTILFIIKINAVKAEYKVGFKEEKSRDTQFQNKESVQSVAQKVIEQFQNMIKDA